MIVEYRYSNVIDLQYTILSKQNTTTGVFVKTFKPLFFVNHLCTPNSDFIDNVHSFYYFLSALLVCEQKKGSGGIGGDNKLRTLWWKRYIEGLETH